MEAKEEKFPAQWALDLLEPTPLDYQPSIFDHYITFLAAVTGTSGSLLRNYMANRPLRSHMHVTALTTVCGGILGHILTYMGTVKRARRDELMRHYIRLHPERFPEPENKKYADIFRVWFPIR